VRTIEQAMNNHRSIPILSLALLASTFAVVAADGDLAPGYGDLSYLPPPAGSYQLPVIGPAADGKVLGSDGSSATLHSIYDGRITVLSFIYATCDDVNGCPLATMVLQKLKTKLRSHPEIASRARLVTLSFSPEHDTPKAMAEYGKHFQGEGIDWRFLTTAGESDIRPILQAYGQSADKEIDEQGRETGKYSHLLKVFLIDGQRQIRNIYTVSVLHADLVLADIQTLLREKIKAKSAVAVSTDAIYQAGDDKRNYASAAYRTQSVALEARKGKPADLLAIALHPPLGLPALPVPKDNPLTREKIALGRKLFYDRRLSLNGTMSCAMCHVPEQGFTSQEQTTAIGIEGRTVRRNAPTIYNVGYLFRLFHDGRESSLENQIWGPFLASNEMGNPSIGAVVDKVKALPDYRGLFEKAFRRVATMETVSQAIASYERTLLSGNSPFDRWHFGREEGAMSAEAKQGYALFVGKAGCSQCHRIDARSALFTDDLLHNTGIGYRESMAKTPQKTTVQLAPGVTVDVGASIIAQVGDPKPADLGQYEVTQNPNDRWKYKTPSLRNVALTAPYMHNGSLPGLREVVDFYDAGGVPNENLDFMIRPLGMSEAEKDSLVAFLSALTGENVDVLVADAFAAPIGNSR
jgi:cytochrome c peroxidase